MDDVLSLLQDFDVANFLPAPDRFLKDLEGWIRFFVLLGPLILLVLGVCYYFIPPKEANHSFGFRTYWSMGSIEAWQFAQKLAGMGYMITGGALTILMGLISISFRGTEANKMIGTAVTCVFIELAIVLALWIGLNLLIYRNYDKEGNVRLKKAKK